jgi:prevent-host-death family protein
MKIINTVELKNHTNEILRRVHRGQPVAVTRRGRPYAAVIPLTEAGLEDLLFEYSPRLRQWITEAEADVKAGRLVTWQSFLRHERRRAAA